MKRLAGILVSTFVLLAFSSANAQNPTPLLWEELTVYRALLTQTGNSAPTANIFNNTVGTITFTRITTGVYRGEFPSQVAQEDFYSPQLFGWASGDNYYQVAWDDETSGDGFIIQTQQSGIASDGVLNNTPIELRIRN